MNTQQILLVGLDDRRLEEFRLSLSDEFPGAYIASAKSAGEARDQLSAHAFAAVVAADQLVDLTGLEFLDVVMAQTPGIIRVLVSDYAAGEQSVQYAGISHHHLPEPFEASALSSLLRRAGLLRARLANPFLPALMAKLRRIPSPPDIYFQLLEVVQRGDSSLDQVGELIIQDQVLSAKVLQLANSAVFGLQLQVLHPTEAVSYLGVDTVRALLLLAHTFSFFDDIHSKEFSASKLQSHAVQVGRMSQCVAELTGASLEISSQCFTAGLLHDIGKLVLAANLPAEYDAILVGCTTERRAAWEVEIEVLGAGHAEVGGSLLQMWNLPEGICEAVTWHHQPSRSGQAGFTPLTAVHLTNALEHGDSDLLDQAKGRSLDWEYLTQCGWSERVEQWQDAVAQKLGFVYP